MTADTVDSGLACWFGACVGGCGHIEASVKGDSDDDDGVNDAARTVAVLRPPRPQPVVESLSIGCLGG